MPWRETKDPYAIWLSEIMLQQTRVDTVVPYYQRFLRRFPDVGSLAAATEDDVLAEWSGLGYYRRARMLHAGAREVVATWGGSVPATAADLRTLPGIGRYTSGAIASIAFGEQVPLVDGNVARVLSRVAALHGSPSEKALYALAEELVPKARPGDFNQALMELGATVCTPERPRCGQCPIAKECLGRDSAAELGRPRTRAKTQTLALTAALVRRGERVLLGKRPRGGLFGGLWEPPMTEATGAAAETTLKGAGITLGASVGEVRHVLTHRVLEVTVRAGEAERLGALAPYEALELRSAKETPALSKLAKRVLGLGVVAVLLAFPSRADAADTNDEPAASTTSTEELPTDAATAAEPPPSPPEGTYLRIFGALSLGKGLRFNNPYRLDAELGDGASSPSFSAAFFDAALALTFGDPDGLQHGGAVHLGVSLEGPTQPYAFAGYEAAYRAGLPFLVHGRIGPVFLLAPDFNVGGEVAGGFSYFFTSGIGLTSELAFDLFYGAATLDSRFSTIPVLSASLGVAIDYEVLP